MARTSSLLSRFRAELLGRVVAMGAAALTTVLLARLLEPESYGLLFLSIAVFSVAELASKLGIAKSAARYIAEYKESSRGQLPHIIRISFLLNVGTIVIVGAGLLVVHDRIADFLGEPDLAPFLVIGVAFVAASSLVAYTRLILQGFEAIKLAALIHVVDHTSKLIFAVGLVLLGFGAMGALIGYIGSYLLAATVGLSAVYLRWYRSIPTARVIEQKLPRRIAEYTIPLTATNTANVLDKQVDTILVGLFLTPVAVAYYVLAKQVVQFIETPTAALGFTLAPAFGARTASGNRDRAARLYERAVSAQLLLYVPAGAGLVLVAGPAIVYVFGPDYSGAIPVLQVLAIFVVLVAVNRVTSNGLDFLGRARERAIAKGVTALMNVALNVVLIPAIGVVGAAIATVCTYGMYTVANVYVITLEFDLRLVSLARETATVLAITAVMALIVVVAMEFVTGLASLAGVIVLGATIWFVLSTATGLIEFDDVAALFH